MKSQKRGGLSTRRNRQRLLERPSRPLDLRKRRLRTREVDAAPDTKFQSPGGGWSFREQRVGAAGGELRMRSVVCSASQVGPPTVPWIASLAMTVVLRPKRAHAPANELPSRLPRRQFRGCVQARRPGPHPRLHDAQGSAAALHRHPRRRGPLRSLERRSGSIAGMARGRGRVMTARPPAPVAELLGPFLRAVGPCGAQGRPFSYPGSSAIAQTLLRVGPHRAMRSERRGTRETDRGARARRAAQHRRHGRICRAQRLSPAQGAPGRRLDRPAVRG